MIKAQQVIWRYETVYSSYDENTFLVNGHNSPTSGPWINIKILSYQYRKSHCGDKTVGRSSYLHNGISYTGKMSSLYWFRPLKSILKSLKDLLVIVPISTERYPYVKTGTNVGRSEDWNSSHFGNSWKPCVYIEAVKAIQTYMLCAL